MRSFEAAYRVIVVLLLGALVTGTGVLGEGQGRRGPTVVLPSLRLGGESNGRWDFLVHRIRIGSSGCSGCFIGPLEEDGQPFVTAGHCVSGVGDRVEVLVGDRWFRGSVIRLDRQSDCCLCMVTVSKEVRYGSLRTSDLSRGDVVTQQGFGVVRPGSLERGTFYGNSIAIRGTAAYLGLNPSSGDSGGPVVSQDGKIVSLVCFTRARWTYGPTLDRLKRLVLGGVPKPRCPV